MSVCRIKTSFKQTTQADGSIRVAVGDLFADEQKDFLLELDIPGVSVTDVTQQVMHVQARYLDISNTCMRDDSFAVTTARTADTAGLRHSHPIVLVSFCAASMAVLTVLTTEGTCSYYLDLAWL